MQRCGPTLRRRALVLAGAATALPARAVPPPPPLVFPRDFGAHRESRIEWWYVTGVLASTAPGAERRFGFQLTFFGSRTDIAAVPGNRFAADALVLGHAAVTDVAAGRLRHEQQVARGGFAFARASEADTAVVLRRWSLVREAGSRGRSRYRAVASSDAAAFSIDLALEATQAVLLQGRDGWSKKGPDDAQSSRYYSEPQLATSGTLVLDGKPVAVVGRAWLDHEWSDSLLAADAVGWDWIGMNLDDGGALTAFRLRRADGRALWAGGSFRSAGGPTIDFAPDAVRFLPGRTWTSPSTRATYPVEWTLETPAGRHTVRPLAEAQELDGRASTGLVYWEGVSDLLDAAGRRVGGGYLEMTGYAGRLAL